MGPRDLRFSSVPRGLDAQRGVGPIALEGKGVGETPYCTSWRLRDNGKLAFFQALRAPQPSVNFSTFSCAAFTLLQKPQELADAAPRCRRGN